MLVERPRLAIIGVASDGPREAHSPDGLASIGADVEFRHGLFECIVDYKFGKIGCT